MPTPAATAFGVSKDDLPYFDIGVRLVDPVTKARSRFLRLEDHLAQGEDGGDGEFGEMAFRMETKIAKAAGLSRRVDGRRAGSFPGKGGGGGGGGGGEARKGVEADHHAIG